MTDAAEADAGVPPLGGICSYERAASPGLAVEVTVARLKRYNHLAGALHRIAAAHLPRTPEWEVKCGLGLHLYLDADHCAAIRERVAEMREPPLRLDAVPDERLRAVVEEAIRARDTVELLAAVYGVLRPALVAAMEAHVQALNPLFDHPTHRLLRGILREQHEMLAWGREAVAALTRTDAGEARATAFGAHVAGFLAAAGGVGGDEPEQAAPGAPRWDGSEYAMDATVRRDERFADPFNASADIDAYYQDESLAADERTFALAYKRLREMDVPECMAPILFGARGGPWDYHRDLARQLWDETRHAMMGEVALDRLGIPFHAYPVDAAFSALLNDHFTPFEAHVLLWAIEQGLMPRETGKRWEWSIAGLDGDPFFVALQDHDWADEVLHARIGRRWLREKVGGTAGREAMAADLWKRYEDLLPSYLVRSRQAEWWPEFVERARAARAAPS